MTDLAQHACDHRVVVVLGGLADPATHLRQLQLLRHSSPPPLRCLAPPAAPRLRCLDPPAAPRLPPDACRAAPARSTGRAPSRRPQGGAAASAPTRPPSTC